MALLAYFETEPDEEKNTGLKMFRALEAELKRFACTLCTSSRLKAKMLAYKSLSEVSKRVKQVMPRSAILIT